MLRILTGSLPFADKLLLAFSMLGALLIAFTMHEWAHGFIAYKNGDYTAKMEGRLSLNPIKHVDPIGFLMLCVAGFGWAKPVPVNSANFKRVRKGIFTVSIAGVTMNLLLAIISFICLLILNVSIAGSYAAIASNDALFNFVRFIIYFFNFGITINLSLMAFNILPIAPLDGFHVLETFLGYNNRYCVFMRRYGSLVLLILILGSSVLGTINPYFDIIGLYINSITDGITGLMDMIQSAVLGGM